MASALKALHYGTEPAVSGLVICFTQVICSLRARVQRWPFVFSLVQRSPGHKADANITFQNE